jgi:hypothetical protein
MPGELPVGDPRCAELAEAWNHVYRPERLQIRASCVAAAGTITNIRTEPDGDLHVLLALDPGQDALLNEENTARQHGELVAELICVRSVRQPAAAVEACTGWENRIHLHRGQHVRITGAYVLDREHGWMELHPVSVVEDY